MAYLAIGDQIVIPVLETGGGVIPTDTITMTSNGTYDVINYATAVVSLPVYDGTIE